MPNAVRIIAEAGVNHNGSLAVACELVDAAAKVGADTVKFQTFNTKQLMTRAAPKADYQIAATDDGSQFDMIRNLELSRDDHLELIAHARHLGIDFMSTPFDTGSADLLIDDLKLNELKLPSGEITNGPLLLHVARKRVPLIVSTGMSTMDEVEQALRVIAFGYVEDSAPIPGELDRILDREDARDVLRLHVTLLHCTTQYPAPFDSVNLKAMVTMAEHFGLKVGYSDHTRGIHIPVAALALGATVIEKHLTLDRAMPGPDHQASLEPAEFKAMVDAIREVEAALGGGVKAPAAAEEPNMNVARRSIVAAQAIKAGEPFNTSNIQVKRPGGGVSPMRYWSLLGAVAKNDYDMDDLIQEGEGAPDEQA